MGDPFDADVCDFIKVTEGLPLPRAKGLLWMCKVQLCDRLNRSMLLSEVVCLGVLFRTGFACTAGSVHFEIFHLAFVKTQRLKIAIEEIFC